MEARQARTEVRRLGSGRVPIAVLAVAGAFAAALGAAVVDDDRQDVRRAAAEAPRAPRAASLRDVSVTVNGTAIEIRIVLASGGDVADGAELFVWRQGEGASRPLWLLRQSGAWHVADDPWGLDVTTHVGDDVITVAAEGLADDVAVSAAGGARLPEMGHLAVDGDGRATVEAGEGAEAIERAVADVQRGFGALYPLQRELALSLLGRQMVPGTFTYDVRDGADRSLTAFVSVRYPELSQVVDGRSGGLYVGRDRVESCATTCRVSSAVRTPAGAAAALVRSPDDVDVEALEAGDWNGQSTRCVRVTSALVDGPKPGRWCWLHDGVMADAELDDGTVSRLRARSELDPTLLTARGS